ncbi:MAG TPA: hypothetical protein VN253_28430 [Kofleriaceae bacterium]|nr:hypothetical protein [Kofleriaceae bacterium]
MTTGRNIVRSITLAAAAALSFWAAMPSASAQGWDPGGPGWIRYPVLYTTAFCEGIGEGACNIVCGIGKTGREIGYQAVDIGGGVVEICGGPRHQNWSQAGQYFDRGGSYGTYYRDFGCNTASFGVYGQVQSTVAYCNGEIDSTTYSQQMGASGVFQLCQARVMYVQGGPGCVWRQPIQNVPAHLMARCTGARTPFDIANGARPGDLYISPACRGRMNDLWQAACNEAEANPLAGGRPRCNAGCMGPDGPIVCQSGTPATGQAGGGRVQPWYPRDFYYVTHRQGGLTCAEPRALVCALRNGQGGPVPTTNGAVINYNGSLYFRPPCGACQSMGNLNPGLINWVNRPPLWLPTDIGAGMCPSQTFNGLLDPFNRPGRPGLGRPGRPGLGLLDPFDRPGRPVRPGNGLGLGRPDLAFGGGDGGVFAIGPDGQLVFIGDDPRDLMGVCPRLGHIQQAGGVDPPFEGAPEEEAVGCCSIGGSGGAPLGNLPLLCSVLYLLVPRRWRGRRPPHGPRPL